MHEITETKKERAILVGVSRNGDLWQTEDHLDELALLADTCGAVVVDQIIQERQRIDAAYFVGKGKAEKLARQVEEMDANLLIFDDDLSPAQTRNLEKLVNRKVLDRSGVILDIFARRAKTREAKTQVELAQLNYLLPRLTRQWTHLSRQVGGIGTRGPGETQLEVDRRLIRQRIAALTRALEKIKKQRTVRRQGRRDFYQVALVGYTNAGKSTLLNALTSSDVFVEDRLFATLDATIRRMKIANFKDLLLIDTVGFIRKLPHNLVASFMSTLEEAAAADLLLHVVDVTHPHYREHIGVVNGVLQELHIETKPTIFVFNKIDQLQHKKLLTALEQEFQPSVSISAARQLFLGDLQDKVRAVASLSVSELELLIPHENSHVVARIYDIADVVSVTYGEHQVEMKVRIPNECMQAISQMLTDKLMCVSPASP